MGNGAERQTSVNSYRDLKVWQRAMDLAVLSYGVSVRFPKEEIYGMTSQVRRAASSVAANIAEGYGRDQKGSYVQHLKIAQGSLKELETHLLLSERISLATNSEILPCMSLCEEVGKMLRALIRSLQDENDGR